MRLSHAYIAEQERSGHHVSPAGEWLLDNFQMLMAQTDDIAHSLPRRYFARLAVLGGQHLSGMPRIYAVAWAFMAHTDSALESDLLASFLNAYQTVVPLAIGEIWALAPTLRVLLVENLRRLAEQVAASMAARNAADAWCDALIAHPDARVPAFGQRLAAMQLRGVGRAFALQVNERLGAEVAELAGARQAASRAALDEARVALVRFLPDPSSAQVQQHADKAADSLSMRNAILALRTLEEADWREVIDRTSVLVRALHASPAFCAEREDTQDASLRAVQRLARRSMRSESDIADVLLRLMQVEGKDALPGARAADASPVARGGDALPDSAPQTPGFWLRGPGRARLHRALGLRAQRYWEARKWLRRAVLPLYVMVLLAASVGAAAWLVRSDWAWLAAADPALWGLGFLALFPAGEAALAVVHRMLSESLPPRRMPRYALTGGIVPEHRVLVVLPSMLTSAGTVRALVLQLEQHYLANGEACAQFALLTDFSDAGALTHPSDTALLKQARAEIEALEARYCHAPLDGASRRFLLLHRERSWARTERCWIGWERKRGKLEQLLQWLAQEGPSPFLDLGPMSQPVPQTPYVLTLDSDTGLPPGTLRALVGVAAHPLNRPHVDARLRRVTSGFGILQPRLITPLPEPATATPFHWLFSGRCGVDPYSAATSEVYQDLFSEGSFVGKGLLNVRAMHAVLGQRLPEGQVLSHDLLEGSLARCATVSDITLMEDAPLHADVAAARIHRWTRGDWQLLPLMLQWRRYALPGIARWKLVDNLRRSLVPPACVVLLVLALAGAPLSPWSALAWVMLASGAGPLIGALAGLVPSRNRVAPAYFYLHGLKELARALGVALWNLATLLQQALVLLHAAGCALWRTFVSRRGLLQWTTAASAQAAAQTSLSGLLAAHSPVTVAAALLWLALWQGNTAWPLLSALLCAAWALTPLWVWLVSRPRHWQKAQPATVQEQAYLQGIARDTWRFFEMHVGESTHHLPPDNVQTVPNTMVAERTSPTNIGLYLLALACARAFGWIDTAQFLARCEATFATLGRLARHNGHFLNWYDTRSLQVLQPAYVSTVDSGNLCGHLLALAGACDALLEAQDALAPDVRARLRALATSCREWAAEPQFGFLYHPRKRLLHIGYRVAEGALDHSFYDLLASEARLASLWAIAKGDLPPEHWGALGRPFYGLGRHAALRSWSGSMFEYLMPALVLDEPVGSALHAAAQSALLEQQRHGQGHGVPWGVSECAYAVGDQSLAYQYAPQGVPRLALRRTPTDELVVAPYATGLATMFDRSAAERNFLRLESLQARTDWGFIEALDFSAERQQGGSWFQPVSTFMAHHQGMILVALANVLLDGAPRRWAMANARLRAVSILLQEAVPRELPRLLEPLAQPRRTARVQAPDTGSRELTPGASGIEPTLLLSNGRYSVSLRAHGAGWSRFAGADLSRWRDDALRDAYGHFIYLRRSPSAAALDGQASALVSLTQHPAADPNAAYRASLQGDRACLHAQWPDLRSCCTVWVSPEDDVELRRVELWNLSSEPLLLDLFSAWEVSLLEARADEAHPAFANLFVKADWAPSEQCLYFARHPHTSVQKGVHAAHFLAQSERKPMAVRLQTDRALWLGRNRDATSPLAHCVDAPQHAASLATGLDPVAVLSLRIEVPAHSHMQFTLGTAAATEREALETLVDRYRQPAVIERSILMSSTFAGVRMREMGILREDRAAIQTLSTLIAQLHARPGPPTLPTGVQYLGDRRALWRFGISGDRPQLLVEISAEHGIRLVRSLVKALHLWSWGGLPCDLVVLNGEPPSYQMPLQRALQGLREAYQVQSASVDAARVCGLHLLRLPELSGEEHTTLRMLARVRFAADGRPLALHLAELTQWHDAALDARINQSHAVAPVPAAARPEAAAQGAFDADSGVFRFEISAQQQVARPWINVLANPGFGTQVSEAGAGYSWAGNSQQNKLTVWTNDPVSDPGGETFWLQDLQSKVVFGIGKGLDGVRKVAHGQGNTVIEQNHDGLTLRSIWCVDGERPVKQVRLSVTNHRQQAVRLRAVGLMEWVLGSRRLDRQSVATACEASEAGGQPPGDAAPVLLAIQRDALSGHGGSTAFFAVCAPREGDAPPVDWTCDRREFFDARGRLVVPDHLAERAGLGLDPCAALSCPLDIAPRASRDCLFLLGHGASKAEALALARQCLAECAAADHPPWDEVARARWAQWLAPVQVQTPDPLFDALVNHWLLYQTVACRMWARAGFYQAGGAFGFRDQLQDAMALAISHPQALRQQLLLSASRQFEEGDVQHWWHPPTGAGVRTHCSDDLLWLPEAAARYVDITGDAAVLDECVPFLDGPTIPEGTHDAYFVPTVSSASASLYEHCARALDRSLQVGAHGLPLMGNGDWNDGMNQVGDQGRGESVWLAWFLCAVSDGFGPLAQARGDTLRVERWRQAAKGWRQALAGPAWDGAWYKRAFFDDGTPLGTHTAAECRIDLIAQAWSVLSGAATPQRQRSAMAAVAKWLVDDDAGLNRLLTPPLQHMVPSAGYIQAYPPGVRENGGQYSHAGVWKLMAQAQLGDGDGAYRTFTQLSPAHRSAHPARRAAYALEPYVMAGDVYTEAPYVGRGGWSWYTGSAAWMHRAAIESMLGLQVRADRVCLRPCLPSHWPHVVLSLERAGARHRFTICFANALALLSQAAESGAAPLQAGEWVRLDGGQAGNYLVVLPTRCAKPPGRV
ncbi:MAG: carbohydrate-binding protein [Burkholderiaceae bacterium]|nr:carbohydrate-binding protein [Burkholderiaceae bacterium]